MNGPALLADHLDARSEDVIALWHATVEREGDVPEVEHLSRQEFLDHIPELLDRLVDRLRGRAIDPDIPAREHGRLRWKQGYDVNEVVQELGHLRTVLQRATCDYADQQDFGLRTVESIMETIHEVIDDAMAEAVEQFQAESLAQARDAEDRIAHQQATLATLFDHLPVGVWVVDAAGRIVGLNQAAAEAHGLPVERALGRLVSARPLPEGSVLLHLDGTPYRSEEVPLARACRGEIVRDEELIWRTASGDRRYLVQAAPLPRPDGTPAGAVSTARDITEEHRLAESLRVNQERFRLATEAFPGVFYELDPHSGRIEFSAGLFGLTGHAVEEAGQDRAWWLAMVHPDDIEDANGPFHGAIARRDPRFETEYRVRQRDGRWIWVWDRGRILYDDQGRASRALGTVFDITGRKELEAELARQRTAAEEASRNKTRLLTALSHDARTPLNAVVLSAELLEMSTKATEDPEAIECLRTIRHSVRNVLDLLGDLLDLTRIDAGAMPAEVSRFELVEALRECVSSVEGQARRKGLECRLEVATVAGLVVETDRAKLKQILGNFLSNAVRYTDRGRIRVFATRERDRLLLSVEDSGVGIAIEDQDRIFDEFSRLEHPRGLGGEGTGLGLAICRRLAAMIRGEIRLTSKPGNGSTFTLALPAATIAPTSSDEINIIAPPDPAGAGTILVAEDHLPSRLVLARILRRLGYRVLEAENGREAIALAHLERPRAILMDVNMPVLDGIAATAALRADPELADVPIFALTGDVNPASQQRISEAGVRGFLDKPVTLEALRRLLASLGPGRSE